MKVVLSEGGKAPFSSSFCGRDPQKVRAHFVDVVRPVFADKLVRVAKNSFLRRISIRARTNFMSRQPEILVFSVCLPLRYLLLLFFLFCLKTARKISSLFLWQEEIKLFLLFPSTARALEAFMFLFI